MASTTGITDLIQEYVDGRKTEDQLVQDLVDYPYEGKGVCPYEPMTPQWYAWHMDDGYDPGTYDEVIRAADTGLLPYEVFHKINDAMAGKWAVGH